VADDHTTDVALIPIRDAPAHIGRELCNGALDGIRIDEIDEPAHGLFLDAIETTGGAIPLQRSNVPGKPRLDKAQRGLFK
jgi:hypothetical protein